MRCDLNKTYYPDPRGRAVPLHPRPRLPGTGRPGAIREGTGIAPDSLVRLAENTVPSDQAERIRYAEMFHTMLDVQDMLMEETLRVLDAAPVVLHIQFRDILEQDTPTVLANPSPRLRKRPYQRRAHAMLPILPALVFPAIVADTILDPQYRRVECDRFRQPDLPGI